MKKYLFLMLLVAFLGSCAGVKRVSPDKVTDLSGNWNDTDAALSSKELVNDAITRPWADIYTNRTGKKPVIIVGSFNNNTSEHINTDIIINEMERNILNSGKARFVANKRFREELRDEIKDQQTNASEETMKKAGRNLGADFMMFGTFNSILDRSGGTTAKVYKVDARLVDIESNEVVWIGSWQAKKIIRR